MKELKPIHSCWFVLLVLFFWGGCLGQELPEVIQITTHPTPDYQPAVSPDGNWLASVSERSGNADIWIKRLPRGNSVQVTVHQADDYEPAWSPDSRKLVFVSKRRDAFGDLWMVKLNLRSGGIPDNEPVQLMSHLGMDRSPCFSPDGRKIVFVSDRSGQPDLWIFDLSTSETRQLTFKGGEEPSWSPDGNWILFTSYRLDPNGDLVLISSKAGKEESVLYPVTSGNAIDGQGRWSSSGMHIVFRRFTMDSDGDGAVTVEDNSTIWQKSMDSQQTDWPKTGIELQITPESERAQHPCFGPGGTLYYTSERGKGRDIWSIPEGGLFKRCASAEAQYNAVWERFGEATSEEALEYSILGYRRVLDYFPNDTIWCSRALIRMSETYQVLGKPRQAREQAERIVQNYRQRNWETAEAILKLSSFVDESIDARLSRCRTVLEEFPDDPSILAEAWIILGDLHKENRNTVESVSAYGRVLALPRASTNWKAQAQLKIGDLFLSQGQWETARQSYLAVLREYGGIPLWRDRAGQRLISQVQGNLQERIAQYHQVIQQFPGYPSLIAEAQLAIADALKRQNQYERAYGELEQMESLVPGLDWAVAKSKIVQAQLRSLSGDDLKGIFLLESVIQNYPSLEGGRYALEAKDTLFALLFRSAERLRSTGDNQLAGVRYRKALDLRFNDVPCHRGWVECLYRSGRLDEAMQEYRTRLRQNPRDPVVLYGLGLALSFEGEKDAGLLEKSNVYLSLSLEENYRLVPPYRTIGFNLEALEKLAEQKQSKRYGWLYRAGKTAVGPLRWAYGLLPFGKAVQKEGYYEKAIQVLSTALELNDERFDPKMEAGLAQNLANNFYNLGEFGFANAYQYYRLRLSHDTTFASLLESASFYERIGHCALYIQEYESAAAYLRRAVQTYADLGREEESLLSMRRLAMLYYQAGQYGDAVQVYQALATRDEKANRLNELELDYRNIAFNNRMVGEDEEALRYALQAEHIFQTWNIPQKPPKKDKVRIELFGFSFPIPFTGIKEIGGALAEGFTLADEAAMVWGLISRSQEALKRHDEAIATEQKRLSLFRNRKDGFAERICLNRLGLLYYKSADYAKAWDCFLLSRVASRKKKLNDDAGAFINTVNLANVAVVEMVLQGQEAHWAQAVQCLEDECTRWNTRKEKAVLLNAVGVLWLLRAKGNASQASVSLSDALERFQGLRQAEPYFREALKLAEENGDSRSAAVILKNLAETCSYAGDSEDAVLLMGRSLETFKTLQNQEWIWRVRAGLADMASELPPEERTRLGLPSDPLDGFELAITELESLPVQEEGSEELLSDRLERMDLYGHAAFQAAAQGMAQRALEIAERGKQKELADILARRPPELKRERHKVAWGNLRYYRSALLDLRKRVQAEKQEKKQGLLRDSLIRKEGEYQELLTAVRDEDPVLAAIAGSEPIGLDRTRKLFPIDLGLIYYLCGESKTLIGFVDADTVVTISVPFSRPFLMERTDRFLSSVLKDSSMENACRELYDILIEPIERFTHDKRLLIIVPDRAFWNLPFEALSDGQIPLTERFEIAYAPSLLAYRLAWTRRRVNFQKGLLVGDLRDEVLSDPLKEIGSNPVSLLGPDAKEGAFKEQAREADVIQVEKWIVPDADDPLRSALVLLPDSTEDGYVHAGELFQWDIRANLFMLPQAVGANRMRWNPDPFFYALCYAGVPSVLTSLWPVDRETRRLFEQTFFRIASTSSLTRALKDAISSIRNSKPAVKQWAGLRLIGFTGMDMEERVRFARENLANTVLEARAYEQKQEYEDALHSYEKALSMSEAVQDTESTLNLWKEIVRIGMKGRLWNKAIAYQMKLIRLAEQAADSTAMVNGYRNLAVFCVQNNWLEAAIQAKSKTIDILERQGKIELLPAQYEDMAFIHERGRDYSKAAALAQKAYELYQSLGSTAGRAKAMIRMGRFLLEAEQVWQARESLETGTALLDSVYKSDSMQQSEGDVYEWASGYSLLGLVCERLTQYDQGFRYQEKALSLFQKIDRGTQAAQTTQYLANLHWKTGNYRMALALQRKALETFEVLQNDKLLIMAYGTLGLIHSSLGDLVKAEDAEQKALDLAEKTNNQTDKAAILKNLGIIRIQQNRFDQAMGLFQKATTIDSTLGLRSGLASDFRNMGNLLVRMNRYLESMPLFRRGIELSNRIGDRRNIVQCLFGIGQALAGSGSRNAASAVLDSGLVLSEPLGIPDLTWRLYRQKASLLVEDGQNESALEAIQKAVDVVEQQRSELKVASFQQGFLDDKMGLYSDAIQLLADMNQNGRAFDFAERAKSRNFIDLLGNQRPAVRGRTDLLKSEQAARDAVQEAQDRLAELSRQAGERTFRQDSERLAWQTELEKRRQAYEDVLTAAQSESPELASFVSVDPYHVDRIRSMLPDSTALLEYYLSADELFSWCLTFKRLSAFRMRIPSVRIEETVRKLREAIQFNLSADRESLALYEWLVDPAMGELREIRHIIFVPHGVLHYLPFSALKNKEGRYIIESYSVSLAPSATVLCYCMDKAKKRAGIKRGVSSIFAMANPDLRDEKMDLPFAEREIQALKRTFRTVTSFSRSDATENALRRSAGEPFRLVHFACHGEYESESPLFSALLLAPDEQNDGRLEAQEIFDLNFDCDLVTLSACETGLAKITRGDEVVGLARSFLFAGTPSVVTSLWKVDDLATAVLMKRFYRFLGEGYSKAEALRLAQLHVKGVLNSHPSAWAAFHLTGDFR